MKVEALFWTVAGTRHCKVDTANPANVEELHRFFLKSFPENKSRLVSAVLLENTEHGLRFEFPDDKRSECDEPGEAETLRPEAPIGSDLCEVCLETRQNHEHITIRNQCRGFFRDTKPDPFSDGQIKASLRADKRQLFEELAAAGGEPEPCRHCGRVVLAGACCESALRDARATLETIDEGGVRR